jgi:anti-anti-sigma factor
MTRPRPVSRSHPIASLRVKNSGSDRRIAGYFSMPAEVVSDRQKEDVNAGLGLGTHHRAVGVALDRRRLRPPIERASTAVLRAAACGRPLPRCDPARLDRPAAGNERAVASGLKVTPLTDGMGFCLAGDLDFSTIPLFAEAVRAFAPGDELQLELTELVLVDSAGLHALLGLARTRRSRSLILVNPRATVMRSFEIASLDQHPAIEIRDAGAQTRVSRSARKSRPLRRTG